MSKLFIATLGERPAAITVALDKLLTFTTYEQVIIITTTLEASSLKIQQAWQDLERVLREDYAGRFAVRLRQIHQPNGHPLQDVATEYDARCYYNGMLDILQEYKRQRYIMHFLVTGGRKAMSIYATLAASLVFSASEDRVYTVLSPPPMVNDRDAYHIKPGMFDDVHLVDMPYIAPRLLPGQDPANVLENRRNQGLHFMSKLSPAEREVAEMLRQNPHAQNGEIGDRLGKSAKTVENQLSKIYKEMSFYLDSDEVSNKRHALIDLLRS